MTNALTRHLAAESIRPIRTLLVTSFMDGVDEREVMELLGHSSIVVTMNIYAHVLDEAEDVLAARMDGLLSRTDVES